MRKQTDRILIILKNNTDNDVALNLFDDGDLSSGGAFTPAEGNRQAQYDMSAQTFPAESMQVIVTYNSVQYPILEYNGWAVGVLTYEGLLTYLNGLGLGSFTDQGGQIVNTEPNYPLVDDNGGMPAVEVKIAPTGVCTYKVDNTQGNVTGQATMADVGTSLPDASFNIAPHNAYIDADIACLTGGYDQKQMTVLGTAPSGANWTITVYNNGVQLFQQSGVGPSVTYASGGFTVNPGDTILVLLTLLPPT